MAVLEQVPDHRSRLGRRYRLASVLALIQAAVLTGASTMSAVLEWAEDQGEGVRGGLGFPRRLPSARTVGRIMAGVDADAVDAALSGWVAARDPRDVAAPEPVTDRAPEPEPEPAAGERVVLRGLAFDGKVMRGARATGGQEQMFAASWHDTGVVAGQVRIGGGDEIGALGPLVDRLVVQGQLGPRVVVTADAKHCQHDTAALIRKAGAHYLLVVKGNQPTVHAGLKALPWGQAPGLTTRDKGHGRLETRTLKAVVPHAAPGLEGAVQALKIIRTTKRKKTPTAEPEWSTETVYALTTLDPREATTAEIADLARGQWVIENKVHRVRDGVFDEDHHAARTGNCPTVWATLRNTAISLLRQAGTTNIAAALRANARDTNRVLTLIA